MARNFRGISFRGLTIVCAFGGKNFSLIWISDFTVVTASFCPVFNVLHWYIQKQQQGMSYFLNILDMGIPLMGERTSNWLRDLFIYLNINPSIILNGWRKCGITNAFENGVPSDGPFAQTLDMFMRFSCTAAINVLLFSRQSSLEL